MYSPRTLHIFVVAYVRHPGCSLPIVAYANSALVINYLLNLPLPVSLNRTQVFRLRHACTDARLPVVLPFTSVYRVYVRSC